MQHVLFILMGASGAGKTTLLQHIVFEKEFCQITKKYSTREVRSDARTELGIVVKDDVTHLDLDNLEKKCDIFYEMNNNKYGVNTEEIIEDLNSRDRMLIFSDIRAIKLLKKKVEYAGHIVKVIYILSKMDSEEEYIKTWQSRIEADYQKGNSLYSSPSQVANNINSLIKNFSRNLDYNHLDIPKTIMFTNEIVDCLPDSSSSNKRREKSKFFFKQYVNNIGLFDYCILNTTNIEDANEQLERIVKYNTRSDTSKIAKHKRIQGPVIFVVCASPKSGKGTLMENLNIMGTSQIKITPKYASRNATDTDKRDGMIALGEKYFEKFNNTSPSDYIHWGFHNNETQYAILRNDIIERLNSGVPQIFVSNFDFLEQIFDENSEIRSGFGNIFPRFVYIYLHRVRTKDEIHEQVENQKKIEEVLKTHNDYIKNITNIDHVIINPNNLTFSEDLHDQMMSIIELYKN